MFQNLLSKQRKKDFKREYYTRLATMCAFLLSGAFVVGLIALFPSYVEVNDELKNQKIELEKKQLEAESNKEFLLETTKSAYITHILETELENKKVTALLNEALGKRPEGISIIGYSYDRDEGKLVFEGMAETRDMVAPFANTLEECESFSSVPVPISDLAEKTNLKFRLNIEIESETSE